MINKPIGCIYDWAVSLAAQEKRDPRLQRMIDDLEKGIRLNGMGHNFIIIDIKILSYIEYNIIVMCTDCNMCDYLNNSNLKYMSCNEVKMEEALS